MAGSKLGEAFVEFGFNVKDDGLQKIHSGINNTLKSVNKFKLALGGTAVATVKFLNDTAMSVAQLEKSAKNTGLALEQLEKWQQVGRQIDITLNKEAITNSIASLQKNLDEIKFGRGDISSFQILGIDIGGKDAFQVLEELRSKVQGLSNTEIRNIVERTGLDSSFVSLLKTSAQEFEALNRQIRLTLSQREEISKYGKNLETFKLNIIAIKSQVVSGLAPILNSILKPLNSFLSSNFFKYIGQVLYNTGKAISMAISGVIKVASFGLNKIFDTIKQITGLEGGFVALGVIMAKVFSPVSLVLGTILLIIDDIMVWLEGGESAFGDFYDSIAKLVDKISPVIDKVKELKEALFSDEPQATGESNALFVGKKALSKGITGAGIGAGVGSVVPAFGTGFGALIGGMIGVMQGLVEAGKQIENNSSRQDIATMKSLLESGGVNPSQRSSVNNNVVQNNTFNITSNKPEETGDSVNTILTNKFENSIVY